MDILQTKISEKTNLELANSRYGFDYIESIEDALRRAQGIAGMIIDAAILSQFPEANHEIHPLHLEHTAKALQLEVSDALTLIERVYKESREVGHVS